MSTINLIHMHKQPNLVDCGLYAIANATAIAFGEAPEENLYDKKKDEHTYRVSNLPKLNTT